MSPDVGSGAGGSELALRAERASPRPQRLLVVARFVYTADLPATQLG